MISHFHIRFNDKVTIDCELSEVRRKQNAEWKTTKRHLRLAKASTSVESMDMCDQGVMDLQNKDDSDSRRDVTQCIRHM